MRDNRKRFSEAAVELLRPLVEEHATPLILLHDKANKSQRRAIWTPLSQGHSQALKTGCIQVHHYKVSPGNNPVVLCDSSDIFSQVLYFHTKQGLWMWRIRRAHMAAVWRLNLTASYHTVRNIKLKSLTTLCVSGFKTIAVYLTVLWILLHTFISHFSPAVTPVGKVVRHHGATIAASGVLCKHVSLPVCLYCSRCLSV